MINDGAQDLKDVVYLAGPGDHYKAWNNTGVYQDFACAAGPVHIPEGWTPAAQNTMWSIYPVSDHLTLAVHSRNDLGILCLFHQSDANRILNAISKANPDPALLYSSFQWPDGKHLTYDVQAAKDRWVMISTDGKTLDRNFDRWALMEGKWKGGNKKK
jgi:hypothetical protein